MEQIRKKQSQILSWSLMIAMILMSFIFLSIAPVRAIDDAVFNVTKNTGYGDELQQALDEADNGDVIEVYEGSFGNINISKPLTLIAPNSPTSVSVKMILVDAVDVIISGLTIAAELDGGGANGIEVTSLENGSLTIENCVFEDRTGRAVRIGDYVDSVIDQADFIFTGNSVTTTSDSYGLLFIPEITDSSLIINSNTFTGDQSVYLVYFDKDVVNSSVEIQDNTFTTFYECISGGGDYIRSSIIIAHNTFTDGNLAIYLSYLLDGTNARIYENTITACEYGIQVYEIGNNAYIGVLPPSTVVIEDNLLTDIDYYGISIDWFYHGSVEIIGNRLHDCGVYGVYLEIVPQNWSQNQTTTTNQVDLDIMTNTITGSGEAAIYFSNLDPISTNHVAINIERNIFLSNLVALVLDHIYMNGPDQNIFITLNDFINNDTGIELNSILLLDEDADKILIRLNNFSGSGQYAVINNRGGSDVMPDIFAQENWWADESGPVVIITPDPDQISMMNLTPNGEPVSEHVVFDPWLARLVITPVQSSLPIGETQTLTAHILDNEGNPVDVTGLTVMFRITGEHDLTLDRKFTGTSAVLSYQGITVGTDTIQGEVFFNNPELPSGEDGSTGLAAEIEVIWIQPDATPTPLPTEPVVSPTPLPGEPTVTPTPIPTEPTQATGEPAVTTTETSAAPAQQVTAATTTVANGVVGDTEDTPDNPKTGGTSSHLPIISICLSALLLSSLIIWKKTKTRRANR